MDDVTKVHLLVLCGDSFRKQPCDLSTQNCLFLESDEIPWVRITLQSASVQKAYKNLAGLPTHILFPMVIMLMLVEVTTGQDLGVAGQEGWCWVGL